MIQVAYDLGATCAIGFTGNIAGGEDFLRYMMDAVRNNPNITVRDAINEAKKHFSTTSESSPAYPGNLKVIGNDLITLATKK
jgi:hypothetical protein